MHEQLVDILRTFNEVEEEPEPKYEWTPTNAATGDRPGDRLTARATWNEILEPHGWVEESKDHWRRPGKKSGEGISATTNYANIPMFYVFSTSAAPLQGNKGYSKFHVYTLLNHGGDFIAAARSALEKYPDVKSKPEPQNEKVVVEKLHLWTIGEILSHDFGVEDWLVENLISKQGMTALSGNPGDYKTWVTIHIALCITRNTPVFGNFLVTQGGVLVIDEEDHLRLLKRRLELLGAKETDNIHYLSQNGIKMDETETRDAILKIVQEKNIKLLILDSLVRVHNQDENDAKGMAKVFSSLQKIIGAGASILFTHHHRKQQGFGASNPGQSMRGSSDILAAVDSHIIIEKKRDEADRLIIRQTKLRQAELLLPFEVSITKGELGPSGFEYAGGYDEKKEKAEEVVAALALVLADGMKSREEIQKTLIEDFGKTAIDDGIKIARDDKKIERVPKEELPKEEKKKYYYRLLGPIHYLATETEGDVPVYQQPTWTGKQKDASNELPASQLCIEAGKQEDAMAEEAFGKL